MKHESLFPQISSTLILGFPSGVVSLQTAALLEFSLWKDLVFPDPRGLREAGKFPSQLCEYTVGLLDQKPGVNSALTFTWNSPISVPINVTAQQWKSEEVGHLVGESHSLF